MSPEGGRNVTNTRAVELFPAGSNVVTRTTLLPEARPTDAVHEVVPSHVPRLPVPSFVQTTLEMPTASEAMPPRSIGKAEATQVGSVVGARISTERAAASAGVVKRTVTVRLPWLPAASVAVTTIVFSPPVSGREADHAAVPAAVPWAPVVAFVQATEETPTLSDACPFRTKEAEAAA